MLLFEAVKELNVILASAPIPLTNSKFTSIWSILRFPEIRLLKAVRLVFSGPRIKVWFPKYPFA